MSALCKPLSIPLLKAGRTPLAGFLAVTLVLMVAGCGGAGGSGGSGGASNGTNPTTPDTTPPSTNPPSTSPPSPVALQASKPGALLAYVQAKLIEQIDQGQLSNASNAVVLGGKVSTAFVTAAPSAAATAALSGSYASTTVQEGGVDEADLMKTDGNRIFTLGADAASTGLGSTYGEVRLSTLSSYARLPNGDAPLAARLTLPAEARFEGLHLAASGGQIALVGQSQSAEVPLSPTGNPTLVTTGSSTALTFAPTSLTTPQTVIHQVSASSGQPLVALRTLVIDGQLIDTRTIGDTLYVVTSWFPTLSGVYPAAGASVAERKSAVARLALSQVLPNLSVTTLAGALLSATPVKQALMADTDCLVQAANASSAVQLTTITAINLASTTLERSSRCLLGGVNSIYMSAQNLYLATSRYAVTTQGSSLFYPSLPVTGIHKLAVNAMAISYRGSGEVSGHLGWDADKTPYRLSEYQNDLRVLTYANSVGWTGEPNQITKAASASPALLTVLREDSASGQLKTLATLPNASRPAGIGLAGEQVYAVRFLADRAYVVTFRRSDPLYVIDLANPADPKVAGELKTNGYSDYLLPVGGAGSGLLLGVGKDANAAGVVQGVKVSLFDVANPAAPQELATRVLGKAGSLSGLDFGRHGINLLTQGNITRIALPVRLNDALAAGSSFYRPSAQNLARFEVDAVSKTLTEKPSLAGQTFSTDVAGYQWPSLGLERAVQVGANVYYLGSAGALTTSGW